jgi:4-amino-4-deoxychorismate lyase
MNQPPLCFETICVQQRQFSKLLTYHQARLNSTRAALWDAHKLFDLFSILSIPKDLGPEKYKCRVTYGEEIVSIEWEKYQPRTIRSLRLVEDDTIDYAYKYKNREALSALHAQRGSSDDVLIVRKGLVTDTSYANVAFLKGKNWYTPAQPLLPGTQRAFLLDEGMVSSREIRVEDLSQYSAVRLFNAMVGWGQGNDINLQASVS